MSEDFPGGWDSKASAYSVGDRIRSLGREDPLEKEMATHSSILAWKIPWTEEPGRLQSMGSQGVGHNWAASLHFKPCQSLCDFLDCTMPGSFVFHYLLEFPQIHVHWVSDVILQSHPLLLPSVFPTSGSFPMSWLFHIRWPKYWSFGFRNTPSNDNSGLISFAVDWFDLPAIQGTLKSFLQHHISETSTLRHSAFLIVQFSHLCMTSGKQ